MGKAATVVERAGRWGANRLLGTRRWTDARAAELARSAAGLRVLEIGSGRQDMGADAYSLKAVFPDVSEFVQSDVNPAFGHQVIDITNMDLDQEFDLILCMNVLEHVFDVQAAVHNLRKALRPGGRLVVAVPFIYPYHDEPIDFWRITEHSLRELCRDFTSVDVQHKGARRFPKGLLAVATR